MNQFVVLVSDISDYAEPDIYGPYTEQEAKGIQAILQVDLPANAYEVEVLPLTKYVSAQK